MTTTTHPVAPVYAALGLVWLCEAAMDAGVDPAAIHWETFSRPAHTVQVRDVDDLARLGDRLGLGEIVSDGEIAYRDGEWADISVRVFCGVEA